MIYAIFTVCALLLILFIADVVVAIRDCRQSDEGRVYLPPVCAFVGGIFGTLCLVPVIITTLLREPIWIPLAFLGFSLLGVALSVMHLNCRITYDRDGFTHRNFFGNTKRFTYDQITGIKAGNCDDPIYVGRRVILLDENAVGRREFLQMVHKRYHTLNRGRPIPRVKGILPDVFNGHVDGGVGLFVSYVAVSLLFVGMLAYFTCCVYYMPATESNTTRHEVVFESWDGNDEILYLHAASTTAEEELLYHLRFLDGQVDVDAIKAICDGQTAVTVYVERNKPKVKDAYYDIKAMAVGDTFLHTFEESQRLHEAECWPLIPVMGGFAVLWAVYCALSIKVGRNPERYSEKVIRLFFKDGYVH